jgi:hypothetical protein
MGLCQIKKEYYSPIKIIKFVTLKKIDGTGNDHMLSKTIQAQKTNAICFLSYVKGRCKEKNGHEHKWRIT